MVDDASDRFADRLNLLFKRTQRAIPGKPGQTRELSNYEVAARIRAAGTEVSDTYLKLLRTGERTNPTMKHIQALADFFGVPPGYFFGDRDEVAPIIEAIEKRDRLRRLVELVEKNPTAALVGLRAGDLSPDKAFEAYEYVERLLEREQKTARGPRRRRSKTDEADGP